MDILIAIMIASVPVLWIGFIVRKKLKEVSAALAVISEGIEEIILPALHEHKEVLDHNATVLTEALNRINVLETPH